MSQYDFGNLESPLSGTALINTHLEPWRNALHSLHSGSSHPSYAQAGTMWLDNTTNPWILKVFDGSDDITLGTLNTSTNTFLGAGISAFGATLIDDADASAARTTLGLGTAAVENTVPANKGGTGQSTYTVGDLLYASGTTALSKLAAGTNGHVLTLSGGVPAWAALPSNSGLVVVRQVFTSSATWTKNANLLYADVEVVGGGGGGGGTAAANSTSSGGGGAGGYSRKVIAAATLGATETVTVGTGGAGGSAGGGAGGTGGTGNTSSFGTHCSATGGAGGVGASAAGNVLGGLGGAGSSGDVNITGNAGGSSISATMSGFGGQGYFGGGARPVGTNIDGNVGAANTGAGGSGSIGSTTNGRAGGAGAAGIVIVTEYRSA